MAGIKRKREPAAEMNPKTFSLPLTMMFQYAEQKTKATFLRHLHTFFTTTVEKSINDVESVITGDNPITGLQKCPKDKAYYEAQLDIYCRCKLARKELKKMSKALEQIETLVQKIPPPDIAANVKLYWDRAEKFMLIMGVDSGFNE